MGGLLIYCRVHCSVGSSMMSWITLATGDDWHPRTIGWLPLVRHFSLSWGAHNNRTRALRFLSFDFVFSFGVYPFASPFAHSRY